MADVLFGIIIDIDNARFLDIGTINCDQVDTDTMPVWNWINILIYSLFPFPSRLRTRWEVSGRASGSMIIIPSPTAKYLFNPLLNLSASLKLQIVSNTSRLFIYIASFFRISDPLNTISSQFVEQNTNHRLRLTQVHVKNASTNLLVLFSCILTVAKNGHFILQEGLIYPKCVSVLTV